ncbi:beta-glucuronidase [Deinococcus budaensis]|uniref:Beta-glucuronidase n=1 Tax=Deinococcus budaensis TaxID=1665626 RepID=A0A7W8GEA9_9DEIO|nr:beta-glucuronidase [Deinococcus budaensis]MBB5233985.1 beta-glucuronidase [Deinococcus budaensis]
MTDPLTPAGTPAGGLLLPQQNQHRNLLDLSGLWHFQLDPGEEGEAQGWSTALPAPRPIPVPCSWNDLYDDARDYLGPAWYAKDFWVPPGWQGQRVFLRVGSANYAARVWVGGALVTEHLGGHLPFVVEITQELTWDRPNTVAIRVENLQLPGRVPPGPGPSGGGVAGVLGGYPATTYDFFPYAGLHRAVVLYSTPAGYIDDVTARTSIEGTDGVVHVRVKSVWHGAGQGQGKLRLADLEADLSFQNGEAAATLRVPAARLWSPQDPHLYPLTVTLEEDGRVTDAYTLDIGLRTVEVRGDQLLLNGEPVFLKGFGKHEDFPLSGRALNLPMWIRDYALLRWVGANSYRTTHYPYAEEAMLLADRLGVLVINEIPAVGLNFEDPQELTDARLAQCLQQLRELIARDKNHPSTVLWCVANEPMGGPLLGTGDPVPAAVESGLAFFRELYGEARRLDPTRPVTLVGVQGGPLEWHGLFDVVAINRYYGWYTHGGRLEEGARAFARELDELHAMFGKPLMVTEFGTDTLPGVHATPPEMWTEEYQSEFLRGFLDAAAERPFVAGMQVWNFADFKTGQGTSRAAGMNFKGVFTRDRRPKLAAHMLRERWGGKGDG